MKINPKAIVSIILKGRSRGPAEQRAMFAKMGASGSLQAKGPSGKRTGPKIGGGGISDIGSIPTQDIKKTRSLVKKTRTKRRMVKKSNSRIKKEEERIRELGSAANDAKFEADGYFNKHGRFSCKTCPTKLQTPKQEREYKRLTDRAERLYNEYKTAQRKFPSFERMVNRETRTLYTRYYHSLKSLLRIDRRYKNVPGWMEWARNNGVYEYLSDPPL